jgi:DNA-binding CsgD family transcriptional regulator/tetratricopeptide (TPR) repeat protein
VTTLRDAARAALARGGADGAVAYLRRALEEPPGDDLADVLHELGSAEARVAAPEALEHLDAARAATSDVRTRALIALELGGPHLSTRQPREKAVEILEEAIEELADEDSALALELENQLVGIARFQPDLYPVAGRRLERLWALAPRLPEGHVVLATLASESARGGASRAEALELAERALAGGKLMQERFDPAFLFAAGVLTASDRLDAAFRLYGEALEDARRRGLVAQFCIASCFRSAVAIHRGALADAVADAESCLGVLDSNRLEIVRPAAAGFLAIALTEQGGLEAANDVLSSAGVIGTDIHAYMYAWFFDARARLLLAEGDANRALDGFLSLGQYLDGIGVRNPALLAWRSPAALALLQLGRSDEARRYADEELARSRQWGAPRAFGKSLIAAGLAHGDADGLALLHDAVAVLEGSEARLEHARALVELGSALRRGNRRSDARAPLRQGLEIATVCGAGPLAQRAETELIATGARPRRTALSGVESLTPSEHRVAEMATGGRTNREIAQALFVTTKTVEVHLSSAYRKLGIRSRSQLAGALGAPSGFSLPQEGHVSTRRV